MKKYDIVCSYAGDSPVCDGLGCVGWECPYYEVSLRDAETDEEEIVDDEVPF